MQDALRVIDGTDSMASATVSSNLAMTLANRLKGDREQNTREAIDCCRRALKSFRWIYAAAYRQSGFINT